MTEQRTTKMKKIDLTSKRFGWLTVITAVEERRHGEWCWLCLCSCGRETTVTSGNLRSGNTKSCGCSQHKATTIHGASKTREYRTWINIMSRCYDPKVPYFKYYGGRGIKVCKRWHDVKNFLADMGKRPPGLTLERIDNDGNYEPSNCRWDTWLKQAANRRPRKR